LAHSDERQADVRDAYVNTLLSTVLIAHRFQVPEGTVRRWKLEAKRTGDDWDTERAATRLSKGPVGELQQDFLEQFTIQINEAFEQLKNCELQLDERQKILASLVESMRKVKQIIGGDDKLPKRAIATQVITLLTNHIKTKHSDFLPEFQQILQTFIPVINEKLK
jgi:transposase